ncbi:unnamed protein product [Linum trigynum]|uniref:RNase H type-1 domain-containing protein n=1 Tax=Linum trigynum TaxID=586398 RepID=A0AAV2CBI0_9ROSI
MTMVRSISTSMAVYPMFSELLPASVCSSLDKVNRQFMWGEEEGKTSFHPIAWEQMTLPKSQGGAGIRPTKLANQAMLAKGGWKLVTKEDSLWTRLLLEKYGRNREGLEVLKKIKGSSLAWRSFTSIANVLKKGYAINVKNGKHTHFWLDPWIMQVPLIDMALEEIPEEKKEQLVADLWEPDSGWRLDEFQSLLPQQVVDQIRAAIVDPLAAEEDRPFWSLTANGSFSASSTFKALQHQNPEVNQHYWKRIWKLQVLERVRVFIWMAVQGKLTTNSIRKHRHLTQDDSCIECRGIPETNVHCLRDCRKAKTVWTKIVDGQREFDFFNSNYDDWLKANLMDDSHGTWPGQWADFLSLVMWYVWKCRNDEVFKGIKLANSTRQHYITAKATEWVKIWDSAKLSLAVGEKRERVEAMIGWTSPPIGWYKLNTDGAAQSNPGIITAGGVLRDHNGDWVGGFCSKIGTGTALLAELWGILQGLDLAWRKGIQFLILESNSQLALQIIDNRRDSVHPHATLLGAIRRLLAKEWVVQLVHTYREGNRVADWLSKHSLVYPFGTYELENPPLELDRICTEDIVGVSFPRQVHQN